MATRTRLPRQAAQETSYTFDESDESADAAGSAASSEDDEYGRKKAKGRGKAKARKRAKGGESDEEDVADFVPRSGGLVVQLDDEEEPEMVDYEVKRVDFGKVLPLETLREIFTYLHPSTFYQLANLSKTWRAVVKSDSMKPLWLELLLGPKTPIEEYKSGRSIITGYNDPEPIPTINGEEVEPLRLAALLFDKTCEHCDRPQVVGCDRFLFRRLCYECRDLNLVPTTDVGKGKTYRDLHPATLQAVTATPLPPRDLRYARHQRSWVLIGDLRDASETLELLQLEDDAESLNKYVETTSLSAKSVQKTLGRAKRLKSSWSVARTKRGEALEAGLAKKYSPRVKQYVLERLAIKEEHAKLTDWIRMRWTSLIERQDVVRIESSTFESCVQRYRMDAIRKHLKGEGIFSSSALKHAPWSSHPLATRVEPLTDEIWTAIRPVLNRVIARYIALNIIARCGSRKKATKDEDDSDEEEALKRDLLKKPRTVSVQGWKWIRPILAELLKHAKQREPEKVLPAPQPQAPVLTPEQHDVKNAFFRERHEKALDMLPSQKGRFYAPRFGEFLVCPTVKQLYDDTDFAVDDSKYDDDLATWAQHLDAIFEEMGEHVVEVRLAALKAILAATTEMSSEEIEGLGADDLADPAFDDAFFSRASSWVNCADCNKFGSLIDVLKHRHTSHPLSSPYAGGVKLSPDAPRPQVELSLEVACAWSAILELANVDADKPGFKAKHLTKALGKQDLAWENGPRGTKQRQSWSSLIELVCRKARLAHRQQEVLAVPVIALKKPYKPRRGRGWWW